MIAAIEALLEHDVAGDPITGLRWSRRTTAKIAQELRSIDIAISDRTVARLLNQMKFSLRVNHKQLARTSSVPRQERDAQFMHIAQLRKDFAAKRQPIISVDAKKKELVGRFKNAGRTWEREPVRVNDHDFLKDAVGIAIPYGIYDVLANSGTVFIGTSKNTSEFAVDSIESWWRHEGRHRYSRADSLAILADSGGNNSPTCRAWKHGLQQLLCKRHGLTVTVAHYPFGASKWNPIEHRLFSEISKNWAGRPLESYETMLRYIETTRTDSGLRIRAHLVASRYEKRSRPPDAVMKQLPITVDANLPRWNYTLRPT